MIVQDSVYSLLLSSRAALGTWCRCFPARPSDFINYLGNSGNSRLCTLRTHVQSCSSCCLCGAAATVDAALLPPASVGIARTGVCCQMFSSPGRSFGRVEGAEKDIETKKPWMPLNSRLYTREQRLLTTGCHDLHIYV